jgi:ABC-type transport system substrate-binding protein
LTDFPQNLLYFMYWRVDAPPFNDVRVRQAVSLALDRDELITVLDEGRVINNAIPAGLESWWLDPRVRTWDRAGSTSSAMWTRRRSC